MALSAELEGLKNLLAELCKIPAPPGFEEPMIKEFQERLLPLVDEVCLDATGNVIGIKRGSSEKTPSVALVAHLDQIGFIVSKITEQGFLKFKALLIAEPQDLPGIEVTVLGKNGPLPGVIGTRPAHILTEAEPRQVPPLEKMYIDIGARNASEAEALGVEVGTPLVLSKPLVSLGNPQRVAGASIDDRAGVALLLKVAQRLKNDTPKATIYFVGTLCEEVGLRGAATALYDIKPNLAIAIDTQPVGGTPDVPEDELPLDIGKGPVIKINEKRGLITHPKVRQVLISAAGSKDIPYQLGTVTPGRSDASAMDLTGGGIPTAALGIPRRYSHSATEVLDLNDLAASIEIVLATCRLIDENLDLARG